MSLIKSLDIGEPLALIPAKRCSRSETAENRYGLAARMLEENSPPFAHLELKEMPPMDRNP
jgi:hypothetical protein